MLARGAQHFDRISVPKASFRVSFQVTGTCTQAILFDVLLIGLLACLSSSGCAHRPSRPSSSVIALSIDVASALGKAITVLNMLDGTDRPHLVATGRLRFG